MCQSSGDLSAIIIMRYNTLRHQLKWNASNQLHAYASRHIEKVNHRQSSDHQSQKSDLLEYMWLEKMVNDIHQYKQNANKVENKIVKEQQREIKVVLKERCMNAKGVSGQKNSKAEKSQEKRNGVMHLNKMIKFQVITSKQKDKKKSLSKYSLTEQKKKKQEQKQRQRQKGRPKVNENGRQIKSKSLPKKINPFNASGEKYQPKRQKEIKKNVIKLEQMINQTFLHSQNDNVSLLWAKPGHQSKQSDSQHKNSEPCAKMERKKSIGKIMRNNDGIGREVDVSPEHYRVKRQAIIEQLNASSLSKEQSRIKQIKQSMENKQQRSQNKQKRSQNKLKKGEKIVLNLQTQKLTQFLGESDLYRQIKQKKLLYLSSRQANNGYSGENSNVNELSMIDRVDTVQIVSNLTTLIQSKQIAREEQTLNNKKQQRRLNRSVKKHTQSRQVCPLVQQKAEVSMSYDVQPRKIDFQRKEAILQALQQDAPLLKFTSQIDKLVEKEVKKEDDLHHQSRQKQYTLNSNSRDKPTQRQQQLSNYQQTPQLLLQPQKQHQHQLNCSQEKPVYVPQQHAEMTVPSRLSTAQNIIQTYYTQQLAQIFDFLDQNKQGKLCNRNCYYRQLPYQLKALLNNIIDDIYTKRCVYTLQSFIQQTKRHIICGDSGQFRQSKQKMDEVFRQSLEILRYKTQLMIQTDRSYKKLVNWQKQEVQGGCKTNQERSSAPIAKEQSKAKANEQQRRYSMMIDRSQRHDVQKICQISKKSQKMELKYEATTPQSQAPSGDPHRLIVQQPQYYFERKYNLNSQSKYVSNAFHKQKSGFSGGALDITRN